MAGAAIGQPGAACVSSIKCLTPVETAEGEAGRKAVVSTHFQSRFPHRPSAQHSPTMSESM